MRSILEKAIAHVLHNEMDKAEALFHKFMVEKARQIHESLRQDEEIDLGEGWDNEIKEEEYFGGDDLADAEDDADGMGDEAGDAGDVMGADGGVEGDDMGVEAGDEDVVDADADLDTDLDAEGEEHADIEDKVDDLTDKIDALSAEFDRLMSELGSDDDEFGGEGDLDVDGEMDGDEVEDMDGEEPHMDTDDSTDLADRMDDDMAGDESEEEPEETAMEGEEMDGDELDEDLADITESVLSELDKVASPGNSDGHGIAAGGYDVKGATNTDGMLPKHKVNDRVQHADPDSLPSKQSQNDSFEREAAPGVKPVSTVVKNTRPGNVRKSFKDTMETKPKEGDKSAKLNSNFAGDGTQEQSPVSGKMKPRVR